MLTKTLFPHLQFLRLTHVACEGHKIVLIVVSKTAGAACPVCQKRSIHMHSHYHRTVADLPLSGRKVVITAHVRRFRCRTLSCPRRIFVERLPTFVGPHARKSEGLRQALEQVAFALGGEAGARLAQRLGMPTSPDTLLRLIRAAPLPDPGQPTVVGIDDWAYKKGRRYGTLICDLERHRPIALLPARSAESVAAWLEAHPSVRIATRDRAGLYADGIARGAPQAIQVADRWHLVDNLADALEAFLLHKGASLKSAAAVLLAASQEASKTDVPRDEMYQGKRRTPQSRAAEQRAEDESAQRLARRQAVYAAVIALHAKGATITDVARALGLARTLVYRYLHDGPPQRRRPMARRRHNVLAPWEPYLLTRWTEGCQTATVLWAEIRAQGFAHSVSNVQRFCASLRVQGPPPRTHTRMGSPFTSVRGPSARQVTSLLLQRAERRTVEQADYRECLRLSDAEIIQADVLVQDFLSMVRERQGAHLDAWIEAAAESGITSIGRFALGLQKDIHAVRAGLTLIHSNGQTEGFMNKLKLTKRSMYGRGNVDLLGHRLLHAS